MQYDQGEILWIVIDKEMGLSVALTLNIIHLQLVEDNTK